MKKARLFLLAALLIGIGSAFTTAKPVTFTDAYGTEDNGATWILVQQEDIGVTYTCDSGAQHCLYASDSFDTPVTPESNKQFRSLSN